MTKPSQNRREFLKSGAATVAGIAFLRNLRGAPVAAEYHDPFPELIEITIRELQAKMRSGELTSQRLVEMYLERIKYLDEKTRSVIETNPDAITIAKQMDSERKLRKVRSALHGVPILIKDNIDTADKMLTTAGFARARRCSGAKAGCIYRPASAEGGCRNYREDQSQRVGEFPFDKIDQWMVGPRRANQ